MSKKLKFSDSNLDNMFVDYFNHFMDESQGRIGFGAYRKDVSLKEKESLVTKAMRSEISASSGVDVTDPANMEKFMFSHPLVKWATGAVYERVIDPIMPNVLGIALAPWAEVVTTEFNTSTSFDIKSNNLFYVSRAGRNQASTEFQREWGTTVNITPHNHNISVASNRYRALCGLESLGESVLKAALSILASIEAEAYDALDVAMSALPATANAQFNITVSGQVNKQALLRLSDRVSAYNGGAQAMLLGTSVALSQLTPDASTGYRWTDPTKRYIQNLWNLNVMEMQQLPKYRSKYDMAIREDKIYVVTPSTDKLLKIVYEGSTMDETTDFSATADRSSFTTMDKSWGMMIATSSTAGQIHLPQE